MELNETNNLLSVSQLLVLLKLDYEKNNYVEFFDRVTICRDKILNDIKDNDYMNYNYLVQCYFLFSKFAIRNKSFALANKYLNFILKIVEEDNFPKFKYLYYLKGKVLENLTLKLEAKEFYKKSLEINYNPAIEMDREDLSNDKIQEIISNLPEYDIVENKVCVYAICKNEINFVDNWLNSMSEADYIVVLDTGSTDGTFEYLKNDSRVYRVEQKITTPFRFDDARNECLRLIPNDANILVSTDLDEIFEPGWAQILRDNWIEGIHDNAQYNYIWCHDKLGNDKIKYWYNQIHSRHFYWDSSIHERLVKDIDYNEEKNITLQTNINLHHYPDNNKQRSYYSDLLKIRIKEDPNDYLSLYYLCFDQFYKGIYKETIRYTKKLLKEWYNIFDPIDITAIFVLLGDCYSKIDKNNEAVYYYKKSIEIDETSRDAYLSLSELYNQFKHYKLAKDLVEKALNKTYRKYYWAHRVDSFEDRPYDILSISYFYLGDKEKALQYINEALKYNPTDKRLVENKKLIEESINNA